MLRKGAQTSPESVQRFRQEALLTTRIGHPGIVDVLDCATLPDGQTYLVMELLRGESLEDAMERPGPAVIRLGWLAEIAAALAAAHRVGVIHRDIKPANLFLATGADGQTIPKILDFGIAKAKGEVGVQTRAGDLLGTPYYLAPEQALSRPLDARADLYSLGVILYEMLTGDIPFVGETVMEVIGQHIHSPPLDPRQAAPSRPIPAKLAELTLSLLAKDPALRPADSDLVATTIRTILSDEREALASLVLGPPEPTSSLTAESPPHPGSSTQQLGQPDSATLELGEERPELFMTSFAAPQGAGTSKTTVLMAPSAPGPATKKSDRETSPPREGRRRRGLAILTLTAAAGLLVLAAVWSRQAPPAPDPSASPTGEPSVELPVELPAELAPPPATDGKSGDPAPGTSTSTTRGEPAEIAVQTPAAAEEIAKRPETTEPATKKPATKKPATKKPATKQPATKQPATKQPATKQPSADDGPTIKTDVYGED